jgi:phosphate transport system substrate-binding protein
MNTESFHSFLHLCFLVPVIFLAGCGNKSNNDSAQKDQLKGKITISGAFALYPMTVKWAEEFKKLHPRVTINISAGGAGKGMADALSKMVDLGMYSKEVSPEEQAKGAWWVPVAKDAVLPTVNPANPVIKELHTKGMTRQQFFDIFISGKIKIWGQVTRSSCSDEVTPFTRSDACGAAEMWAKYLNRKKQEDLLGIGVNGDPGVAEAVKRTAGGIGFNNLNFVYDMHTRKIYPGIEVIPIDLNENGKLDPDENFYGSLDTVMKAINSGKYPSPPARDLYLVSNGKPVTPLVRAFLEFVLTDGQRFVNEAGYVRINEVKIKAAIQKLQKP